MGSRRTSSRASRSSASAAGLFRTERAQRAELGVDQQVRITELPCQLDGASSVRVGDRRIVRPVVHEPHGGRQRVDHRPVIGELLGQAQRLLVGGTCRRAELLAVERHDPVRPPQREQRVELRRSVAGEAMLLDERAQVVERLLGAEQLEQQLGSLQEDRGSCRAGRRHATQRHVEGVERFGDLAATTQCAGLQRHRRRPHVGVLVFDVRGGAPEQSECVLERQRGERSPC